MRDSTLEMRDSAAQGSKATLFGGFMSAINSRFDISLSIIEEGISDHGCVLFTQGNLQSESEVTQNRLYRVNIRNHKNGCNFSLIKVVNADISFHRVRFMDNEVQDGGTNGIIAISAKL